MPLAQRIRENRELKLRSANNYNDVVQEDNLPRLPPSRGKKEKK